MLIPKAKPKPANWKVVLTTPILLLALLFPGFSAANADEISTDVPRTS
ncbi:MAG: hypothetical protein F2550_01855, partial [Actinobacteria bacterium]|nr:hypothetical protein [Actinomycetota bacterium]